jgi:hypothetical protein
VCQNSHMPALPVVPNVARVEYLFAQSADQDVLTRTFWNYTGGSFSSGNAADMATAIVTALGDEPAQYLSQQAAFTGVRVTDLASDTAGDGTATASVAGTRGNAFLPADACAVANYTIDRRYRGGHPKGFWPFGVAGDLSNEQDWTESALTAFLAGVQDFFSATQGVSAGGSTLESRCVVSYYSGNKVVISPTTGRARNVPQLRANGPVTYDVLSTEIATRVGSQRRRLGR